MSEGGRGREQLAPVPQGELDGLVRALGDRARTVNLSRAAGLSAALDRAARGELDEVGRLAAADLAHQLVGSAGTFGFTGVSDIAGDLREFLLAAVFDSARVASARRQLQVVREQLSEDPSF